MYLFQKNSRDPVDPKDKPVRKISKIQLAMLSHPTSHTT